MFMASSWLIIIKQMSSGWKDVSSDPSWGKAVLVLCDPPRARARQGRSSDSKSSILLESRGVSLNTGPAHPSAVEGQAARMSLFTAGACLALWLVQGQGSHLLNLSWQVQVLFGTARLLLRSLLWSHTALCTEASVHQSGSRWDQPVLWCLTCLLPACAVQHLSQQDCSSCSLALWPKPASPLHVDWDVKVAGISLAKPKVAISWLGSCFQPFALLTHTWVWAAPSVWKTPTNGMV